MIAGYFLSDIRGITETKAKEWTCGHKTTVNARVSDVNTMRHRGEKQAASRYGHFTQVTQLTKRCERSQQ